MSPTLPLLQAERPLLPQPRTAAVFHRSALFSRRGQGKKGVAAGVHRCYRRCSSSPIDAHRRREGREKMASCCG
nr:hypothetical protein Itr_chr13CG12830 [Ipomoea trifida]GLL44645.1 hypothetical protein Itr_chr13CG12840 [Ipomoea trifida]